MGRGLFVKTVFREFFLALSRVVKNILSYSLQEKSAQGFTKGKQFREFFLALSRVVKNILSYSQL
jgi:hypothetical protein